MSRSVLDGLMFAPLTMLPSASLNAQAVMATASQIYFSDGTNWTR